MSRFESSPESPPGTGSRAPGALAKLVDPPLVVNAVSYRYGDVHVLSGVTFHVSPGESVVITGANGAGKTTLVKLLAGALRREEGDVSVCGFDVERNRRDALRLVGYVADSPFFYDRLRGLEHLAVMASIFGGTVQRGLAVAHSLGLDDDLLGRTVGDYSLGTRQKLAFASAFCHDPKLLVMDEPFASLDERAREVALDAMAQYLARGGAAVFVSHNQPEIERATRQLTITHGTIGSGSDGVAIE